MRGAFCLIAAALMMLSGGGVDARAQQAASAKTQPKDPVIVRETGPLPSYKDLKYPTLAPVKIPKPEIFTLGNGLKVYLLEDHELPLVSGRALVRTGNLFDPKEKRGLAEITGTVMRSGGTTAMTGDKLDETLENMAASIESGIGESTGSASFSCLKENTDAVLALFYDVVTQPAFREDKLDLAKTQIKSAISRRNDNAPGIAQRELYSLVYGTDTPYGGEEEYDSINAITRNDVVDFYKRSFFPSNIILSVYGDFDSAAMKQKLTTAFGKWIATTPKMPPFPKVDAPPIRASISSQRRMSRKPLSTWVIWGANFMTRTSPPCRWRPMCSEADFRAGCSVKSARGWVMRTPWERIGERTTIIPACSGLASAPKLKQLRRL